jgi:AcrR family transcriptional regulator
MTTSDGPPAADRQRQRNPRGQGGRLRQELITAARKLLASADAESDLTIRGISRAAGVHPQAFYLQFDNLDALLYEVYAAEFSELTSALQQAAAGAGPGAPALRAMCQEYARFALSQPARYRLLMTVRGQHHAGWRPDQLPGAPALRLLREALAAARPSQRPSASQPVQQVSGHSPDQAVVLLWATLHGLVTLRVGRPSFPWPSIEQLIDQAVDTSINSLAGPPASKPDHQRARTK